LGIAASIALFGLKLWAGLESGSTAVLLDAVRGLYQPRIPGGNSFAIIALVVSIVTKAVFAQAFRRAAKPSTSPAMDARHVEIHIEVDRTMTIQRAHDIVKAVGQTTEELEHIIQAFVHTDPVPV